MTATSTLDRRVDAWPQRISDWFDMPDLARWFDRVGRFDEFIRIEESLSNGSLVVKAELPGIDPERDVDITVADGLLTMRAERRDDSVTEASGRRRTEFRYGSFTRTIAVPKDVKTTDITATYHDGILIVTVPVPAGKPPKAARVPVQRN